MKRTLLVLAVLVVVTLLLNSRLHLYDRWFNPSRFYFVTVRGTEFYLEGEPFRFLGANTRLVHGDQERGMVAEALQHAQAHGIRVIRQWAIGECENDSVANHHPVQKYYFQAGPNNWVEESFVQLDSVLAAASRLDLKVMITLINNWQDYGGMPMYLKWRGLQGDSLITAQHDSFFTDPQIETWVKGFIHKLVTRQNTVTGKLYRDDPTIFSWELANEARVRLDKYPEMIDWTRRMAEYVKQLDPHHLVSISLVLVDNRLERDHIKNVFRLSALDYVDLHMYPAEHWWENMLSEKNSLLQLVDDYTQTAHYVLRKPLVIGEFGFRRGERWLEQSREQLFAAIFDQSLKNGVAGVMVWSYSDPEWDDVYEINWRKPEHAALCSLMTVYGAKFRENKEAIVPNPNLGPQHGDSYRIQFKERTFATDTLFAAETAGRLVYDIPVRAYDRAKWPNFNYRNNEPGFAFVFGVDEGYFEYPFFTTKAETLAAADLRARLSTSFPPVPGADTLGVSEVTISLNDFELGTLLVRPQQYFGTIYAVNYSRDHGRSLLVLPAGRNALRFEIRQLATQRNGLLLLGEATSARYRAAQMPIRLEFTRAVK